MAARMHNDRSHGPRLTRSCRTKSLATKGKNLDR